MVGAADVSDQFWPTIATVVPVLALALIVEARATIAQWDSDFPWLLRSLQGLSWAFVLVLFAIVETVAFYDLAGNERSGTWVSFAIGAIISSLATLIFTPALSILAKTNAGAAIRFLTRFHSVPYDWKRYRLSYSVKKEQHRLTKGKKEFEALLAQATAVEGEILAIGQSDSPELQSNLAKVRATKKQISDNLEAVEAGLRKAADIETKMDDIWGEFTQSRKAFIKNMDAELSSMRKSTKNIESSDKNDSLPSGESQLANEDEST
jgi:hypothetical protein